MKIDEKIKSAYSSYFMVEFCIISVEQSNASKIDSFHGGIPLVNAGLVTCEYVVLLGIGRRLVIVVGKKVLHANNPI